MAHYKIFFYIIVFTLCMFLYAEEQDEQIDINKYQDKIYTMFSNFSTIIETNQVSENVYGTFIIAENAIRNNVVSFKIDKNLDNVLSGMAFRTYESGEISLVFGVKFLDLYNENSSIHYSILIHEYRHLHDYLKNRIAFQNAKTDEKELYWYELDALRIEAEFIKYYLHGKYNLSKFDEYLLHSFENDNLNIASILLEKEQYEYFFLFR